MREASPYDYALNLDRPDQEKPRFASFMHFLRVMSSLQIKRSVFFGAVLSVIFVSVIVIMLGRELRELIDAGFMPYDSEKRLWAFVGLFSLIGLMAMVSFARSYYVSLMGEQVSHGLRQKVFSHLLRLDITFFEDLRVGEILSRLTTDCALLQIVVGNSLAIGLRNILLSLGGLTMMLLTSPRLTLWTFALVPFVLLPIIFFGKKVDMYSRRAQDATGRLAGYMEETLNNIRTVQAFTHETIDDSLYRIVALKAYEGAVNRNRSKSFLSMLVMFVVSGGVLALMALGINGVMDGRLSAGNLTTFIIYACVVAGAMGSFSDVMGDIIRALGAFDRLENILKVQTALRLDRSIVRVLPIPSRGIVAFHNVSFGYSRSPERYTLDNVSFSLVPGETLAVVGPSGAGKSTILSLLMRFYDPQMGSIYFDGVDLRDVSVTDLRSRIGVVGQDPDLFSTSIYENILYGRPNASEADVHRAVSLSGVESFLGEMPQGLQTRVGVHGVRLSGGQKQRVAIARAILRDPVLFLLDEATNALDAENEEAVQKALRHLSATRTTVVVAHRLATVLRSDRIIILDQGRILDVGTHTELVNRNPLYRRLATLQFPDAVMYGGDGEPRHHGIY